MLPKFLRPEVVPFVEVVLVPVPPAGGPVVEVSLVEQTIEEAERDPWPDVRDEDPGSKCSMASCGYCGRCS